MTRKFRILMEGGVDVTVALILFVFACVGCGWDDRIVTPQIELHPVWLTIGMLPFVGYASFRGVFNDPMKTDR